MAIAAGAFELRTTGNDFNAGYFNAARGGTDYSQQDAPQLTALQEIVSDGSTTLSSTSGLFTAAMVGNGLMLGPGGSGVLYEIVSVADAFHATVDRAVAAATDQDVRIGGALASPGRTSQLINASVVSGNKVYQKSGTYTITTTTANVAGGRVNLTVDNLYWIGYGAARGDEGTKPVISAGTQTSFTIFNFANNNSTVRNVEVDGNSKTGVAGFARSGGTASTVHKCLARNCPGNGFSAAGRMRLDSCRATGNNFGIITNNDSDVVDCVADANTNAGIYVRSGSRATNCIAKGNGGGGFVCESQNAVTRNCTADGNTGDGFATGGGGPGTAGGWVAFINCLSTNNTGKGFFSSAPADTVAINCAHFNDTGGGFTAGVASEGTIALSGDPYVNRAGGNFALNSTAGAGAAVRAASFPSSFPGVATSTFSDIGAAQHQDAGGVIVIEE
jgi:hypothetical protein